MVRTQMEVEVEVENPTGEIEPMVTIEEEEDVVLFWDNGRKSKSVRELAAGALEGTKEDQSILSYYRYSFLSVIFLIYSIYDLYYHKIYKCIE